MANVGPLQVEYEGKLVATSGTATISTVAVVEAAGQPPEAAMLYVTV